MEQTVVCTDSFGFTKELVSETFNVGEVVKDDDCISGEEFFNSGELGATGSFFRLCRTVRVFWEVEGFVVDEADGEVQLERGDAVQEEGLDAGCDGCFSGARVAGDDEEGHGVGGGGVGGVGDSIVVGGVGVGDDIK